MSDNKALTLKSWIGGCNSLLPPESIRPDQYSWLINGVNRGGIVQTRPGYQDIASILGVKAQGGTIFTPANSRPMMLIAVDGLIYRSKFPFKSFVRLEGVTFSDTAPIITFQRALKSVKLLASGALELITPTPVVIIQDGTTKAGVFDGSTASHSSSGAPFFGIPIGLWMAWVASRLWVFNGPRGYVSDLASPDTFFENTYIAERSNFELPGDVTGAVETADEKALLVFTETTTTSFKANIRDRTKWGQTDEFQKVVLPSIGCVSGRSPINQYGLTWWYSRSGFINFDVALSSQQSSVIASEDEEMMRSKRIMSPDKTTICSTFFENYMLISVPAGGRYNEHTWVADKAVASSKARSALSWCGTWTGTRPVCWMKTSFAGRERIYFLSYDVTAKDDTNIHVWEAFKDDRRDNRGAIGSQMESAMITADDLQRFQYAELSLTEILGPVELSVYVAGKMGPWHLIKETTFQAEIGSIGSAAQMILTKESILEAYKPQSREIKTESFSAQDRACSGVETNAAPGLSKGFQILLEWRGRMGVKEIRIILSEDASAGTGECKEGEVGQHNILTERGASSSI